MTFKDFSGETWRGSFYSVVPRFVEALRVQVKDPGGKCERRGEKEGVWSSEKSQGYV